MKMPVCPNCENSLPFWKKIILTSGAWVQCAHCDSVLKATRDTEQINTHLFWIIGSGVIFFVLSRMLFGFGVLGAAVIALLEIAAAFAVQALFLLNVQVVQRPK